MTQAIYYEAGFGGLKELPELPQVNDKTESDVEVGQSVLEKMFTLVSQNKTAELLTLLDLQHITIVPKELGHQHPPDLFLHVMFTMFDWLADRKILPLKYMK